MNQEFGLGLEFIEASAEAVPLPDASFDIAFSEYGASIWCDPYRWIPEASRLLRPGGELIFLVNGTILMLCSLPGDAKVTERLVNDYFGMHRWDWPDEGGVDFHIGYGGGIRVLRAHGLGVEDLIRIQASAGAPGPPFPLAVQAVARRLP